MTKNERCGLCGGNAELVRESIDVEIGNRTALVEVERFRCSQCEEAFYTPQQMRAAQVAAATELRRQERLLSPSEIRGIREQYDLSQSQFERLLGAGPKTVVRWERGTVFQNRSTDALLRVIRAVPEAARFLAELNGVECRALKREFRPASAAAVAIDFPSERQSVIESRAERAASVFISRITEKAVRLEGDGEKSLAIDVKQEKAL